MAYTATADPTETTAGSSQDTTIIHASGIEKSYGDTSVLTGVDVSVPSGTAYALLGPNGAGKSTLVRILSTLTHADAGVVLIDGHDLRTHPDGVKDSISVTGQHAAVDDLLTGRENLEMIGRLRRLSRAAAAARAAELIADFDLADVADRLVKTYSGGTRRKLDLALSLVTRPPLIFLDEPTTGLDPRSREALWTLIRGLVGSGVTIFLTTQYLEEADRLADRVAVLSGGRIVAEGTPAQLKARVGGEVVALEFADRSAFSRALTVVGRRAQIPDAIHGAGDTDGTSAVLEVPTDGTGGALRALLDTLARGDAEPSRLTIRRPSLDDVFLALTVTPARPSAHAGAANRADGTPEPANADRSESSR
jgi:ABC-2 type transport system ATP-binding protein